MTVTQAPPIPFGRHVGVAARAARALLDDVLVREATTYETWIVLNMLATGEPGIQRDSLEQNLATGLEINDAATSQLLGQLEQFGLIRTNPVPGERDGRRVEMTAEGVAHYRRLLSAVNQRSAQVLGNVDPDDLQTTIRVLGQFKERADAKLAR